MKCECEIIMDVDDSKFLFVCSMHYSVMLDMKVDYGLVTNLESNQELNEKYGIPIIRGKHASS